MKFSILTYNVLFNNAVPQLATILNKYKPDIVCLQEVDTSAKNLQQLELDDYRLADYSNSFIKFGNIYGVATFYKKKNFRLVKSDSFNIPRSFFEILLLLMRLLKGLDQPRTMLGTDFVHESTKKKISVYNIHLTVMTTNTGRMKQINQILETFDSDRETSCILAGDFNYFPYARKNLENLMEQFGLKEATHNIPYTIEYTRGANGAKMFHYSLLQKLSAKLIGRLFSLNRLKLDYIFFRHLQLIETKRVRFNHSDHFPIISEFEV